MSKKKRLPPGVRYRDGRYTFRYSVTRASRSDENAFSSCGVYMGHFKPEREV